MPPKSKRNFISLIELDLENTELIKIVVLPLVISDMDKQKTNLLDAYVRKAIALGKINMIESKQSEADPAMKPTAVVDDIDAIYTEVGKFIDYFDQKVIFHYLKKNKCSAIYQIVLSSLIIPAGHHFVIVARTCKATLRKNAKSVAKDERREATA